jgi:hypothetical protein
MNAIKGQSALHQMFSFSAMTIALLPGYPATRVTKNEGWPAVLSRIEWRN